LSQLTCALEFDPFRLAHLLRSGGVMDGERDLVWRTKLAERDYRATQLREICRKMMFAHCYGDQYDKGSGNDTKEGRRGQSQGYLTKLEKIAPRRMWKSCRLSLG
jgi:hypothetical protein